MNLLIKEREKLALQLTKINVDARHNEETDSRALISSYNNSNFFVNSKQKNLYCDHTQL